MHSRINGMTTALLVSIALAGCGTQGPPTVELSGSVTLDGSPVETGTITFEPADGKGTAVTATIERGRFVTNIQPGPKQVRVSSQKVVGTQPVYPGSPDSPVHDIVEEVIPPQFNRQTTLEMTVTEAVDVDIPLESK